MTRDKTLKTTTTKPVLWRRQKDHWWMPIIWYGFFVVAVPYLIWRATIINWSSGYGIIMYLAELYGIITTGLFLFVTKKLFIPQKQPAALQASVDVLIPSYNEPLDILEPVVLGAIKIRGVGKVLVLDDGNRREVKQMAQRLGAKYFARTDNLHAKAGNMNNGLKHTSADFIITLDADHIPIPSFIEETLGFFTNPELAFVQTPQTFYNTHSFLFRHRRGRKDWHEQLMFYDCLQPAKNNWNAAFFVGTSAILRRAAIDDIGGFATGTATEDIHSSLRLHAQGWQSLFLPKPLAYGLEAENFKEFYKQRRRWAAGSLGLLMRSPDSPLRARGLTIAQRLNYLSACLAHLQGVQKLFFIFVPVISIFTNISPVSGNLRHYLVFFGGYLVVAIAATWSYSRGTYHPIYTEMYSMANILASFGGLRGVFKVQKKFAVSSKTTQRRDGRELLYVMWFFVAIGVIAVWRASLNYLLYGRDSALAISSLLFVIVNSLLLISFLRKLRRYEEAAIRVEYQAMAPSSKYIHITHLQQSTSWATSGLATQ